MSTHYFSSRLFSVLALVPLAGCESAVAPSATSSPTPEAATARELFSFAEDVARSADPASRLVGAQMIETDDPARFIHQYTLDAPDVAGINPDTADSSQLSHAVVFKLTEATQPDQFVGDGNAEACAFYFEISTGLLALVVRAHGSIAYNHTVSAVAKFAGELQWPIDTKDASNLFAAVDSNFNQLRGKSHVVVWDLVKSDSENAYWQGNLLRASPIENGDGDPHLDGNAPDYCELADFKVDAVTGTILSHGNLHTPTSGKEGASQCDD